MKKHLAALFLFLTASFMYCNDVIIKNDLQKKSVWEKELYAAPVFKSRTIKNELKNIQLTDIGLEIGLELVNKQNNFVFKVNGDICRTYSDFNNEPDYFFRNPNYFSGASFAFDLGSGYNFRFNEKSELSLLGIYGLTYVYLNSPTFRAVGSTTIQAVNPMTLYYNVNVYQEIHIFSHCIGVQGNYRLKLNKKLYLYDSLTLSCNAGGFLNFTE
nr:hypothetical protein [Treponema sp.]